MLIIICAVFTGSFLCATFSLLCTKNSFVVYDFKSDRSLNIPPPSLSMAAVVNGSFASPIANLHHTALSPADGGLLSRVYNGMSGLSVTITVLLMLVAYDQCEFALYMQLLRVAETMAQLCMSGTRDRLLGPRGKCPSLGPSCNR